MGQLDRQRHQLLGLVARVAEHQALIAGALLGRVAAVDALRDVGRLALDRDHDGAGVGVEADLRARETDITDDAAHDALEIEQRLGGDLAGDQHEAGLGHRFAGDPAERIDGEATVEDRIAHLIAQLVGVTFGDGLGREQVTGHGWRDYSVA